LKRLEDFNRAFPSIQTRMIGVSKNARGNGVIWTVQPFVEAREFKEESQLQKALEKKGWERLGSGAVYRHKATGVVIGDAHGGNVFHDEGELYPVEVIVSDAGKKPVSPFSRANYQSSSKGCLTHSDYCGQFGISQGKCAGEFRSSIGGGLCYDRPCL